MINKIKTEDGLQGEYEIINNFSMKVRMTEPYQVCILNYLAVLSKMKKRLKKL